MPYLRIVLVSTLLLVAANAAGYSVQVNKVSDFPTAFTTLAMLPASGPTGFDTIWLETLLAEKLTRRGITIIPARVVRQAMFDLQITAITEDNRRVLAQKVGADAFLAASVDAAGTENAGSVGVIIAGVFTAIPSERNTGSVQLAIVSAESGKLLMQGYGHGQSELRTKRGVIGKTFDNILDKVFTPDYFAKRGVK